MKTGSPGNPKKCRTAQDGTNRNLFIIHSGLLCVVQPDPQRAKKGENESPQLLELNLDEEVTHRNRSQNW
jgi:hypothetical protein